MSRFERYRFEQGTVDVHRAWTTQEVRSGIEEILDHWGDRLPKNKDARVVLKPNLNNDLVALVGNCVDLRVLCSIIEGLMNRGYRNIMLCDGSNVGIARRDIDSFKRLRVDKLVERYGIQIQDLNHDEGLRVALHAGARPLIARTILESDFLISIPKVKTHCEAGLSCAMKNWVGIARGQDKREMHRDLGRNIFAINEAVLPDLIIVDGLVGMEGNGPGDGEPFRFGILIASDNAFLNDLVVSRLVDMPVDDVPYLLHALDAGRLTPELRAEVADRVPIIRPIKRAPKRSKLAEWSEARSLMWLKKAVRPALEAPGVMETAYRLKIVQDVYSRVDDTIQGFHKNGDVCGECTKCADFCPTHLSAEDIGVKTDAEDCIQCLYCWWVCPKDAIILHGELNHLERQVERYKDAVQSL
jgi:uncharacterized protein (DUF362 family)/ferredoxin